MTINEIFEKYYGDVSKFFRTTFVSVNNINQISDDDTYIIINDLPETERESFDILFHIFTKRGNGSTLFINDISMNIISLFLNNIQSIKNDKSNNIQGVSITHIVNVGYIIVALHNSDRSSIHEYTLEEYTRLSEQYIVIGMAKQEGHYIKDWVAYHLRIGFDKVILYDNNDPDGESYNELLSEYTQSGKLDIIDVRGKKGIQQSIYNSMYYSQPFKMCAIIDIDEFIWFNETGPYSNIKQFAENIYVPESFGIMLQWHCYAGSGDDTPSDRPVWEVCSNQIPFNARKDCRHEYINDWSKSIYKKGWPIAVNEHFGWLTQTPLYDLGVNEISSEGNSIYKESLIYISENEFNNQPVFVKHFLLRNINEFYHKKYLRGHAGIPGIEGADGWAYYQWRQNMNYYTDITPVLTEKEQLFMNKQGMKVNYTFHPDVFVNLCMLPGSDYINNTALNLIIDNILPNTNTFLKLTTIDGCGEEITVQPNINEVHVNGDLDFLTRYATNYNYLGIDMNDESKMIRQFIQEPVIINIGFPEHWAYTKVSTNEIHDYLYNLRTIFMWDNLKPLLKKAISENVTSILKIGTVENGDCFKWVDTLNPWMKSIGLNLPYSALTNNTYIMPYRTFLKYKKFQNEFIKKFDWAPNSSIIVSSREAISTPFHAFLSSMLAPIDNIFYVWPN